MKLTIAVLLLAAAVQTAEVNFAARSKKQDGHTEKRALAEGNAALAKRAPVLASPTPTPGIEYADSTEAPRDKSPIQQIYSTPIPRIAKISDVLTGQGPAFQAAIASHLYSPVSIYQARLSPPTTYQVSAPIPSQLAYSEKITYQPGPNAIQFTPQIQKQKISKANQLSQPIVVQPIYQQNPQQIYQQIPIFQQLQGQNVQFYTQVPNQVQLSQPLPQIQSGVVYAKQEAPRQEYQLVQRESKAAQLTKPLEKQASEQNYNTQHQGAVSYASFSQGFPTPAHQQLQQQSSPQIQINQQKVRQQQQIQRVQQQQVQQVQQQQIQQVQPQYEPQLFQAQIQYQQPNQFINQPQYQVQQLPQYQLVPQYQTSQPPQYQTQSSQYQTQPTQYQAQLPQLQAQPTQYQVQPYQIQLQPQPQIQYFQSQPLATKIDPSPANSVSAPLKPENKPLALFRANPGQTFQSQFPGQLLVGPGVDQGFGGQVSVAPVQYFGKFAQAIFGGYQPQK